MCLAAGGLDNVLCVTGFAVFIGIIFSEGILHFFVFIFELSSGMFPVYIAFEKQFL